MNVQPSLLTHHLSASPSPRTEGPAPTLPSVSTWDESAPGDGEGLRLISLFAAAPDVDPVAFLRSAAGSERFYWAEPATHPDSLTMAGAGVATEARVPPVLAADESPAALPGYRFEAIGAQARRLFAGSVFQSTDTVATLTARAWRDHPARPRLFGGFAFQDDFVPDHTWSVFSPAHFILPHYQCVRAGGQTYVTINALVGPDEDITDSLSALREALSARLAAVHALPPPPAACPRRRYPMTFELWHEMIAGATAAMHGGELEKVVLSRVCEIRATDPIDATAALDYLNDHYGDCFRFIFEPVPYHAFLGATPELLVRKTGERLQTMALAGSAARGRTSAEDNELGDGLLHSAKERHEHRLVVEAIADQLTRPTADLTVPAEPTVLRLHNIQHLLTPIDGRLNSPETDVLALVRLLHPTPAMGGVPPGRAMAFLQRAEPMPRGWYAAPIGWLDAHCDGVFAVAIRSAVTQHARAWLYAGAGIVADSQPEHEWAETALKFRPMLSALGWEETA